MISTEYAISVIIPVHNAAPWLHRVLDALFEIQYPRLEIIAVENASTDNSIEILKKYQGRGIIVARNDVPGVSKARNTGISLATAPYIMFVDADDIIDVRLPSVLLEAMNKTSADMAICDFVYESECGEIIESHSLQKVATFENDEILDKILNYEGIAGYPICKLFHAKIIKDYSLKFDENLRVHEDLLFVLMYSLHCKRVAYTPFCGYHYIHHENTANTTVSFRYSYGRLIACYKVCNLLKSKGKNIFLDREKNLLFKYLSDSIKLFKMEEYDEKQEKSDELVNLSKFVRINLCEMLINRSLPISLKMKFVFICLFGLNTWYAIQKVKNCFGV